MSKDNAVTTNDLTLRVATGNDLEGIPSLSKMLAGKSSPFALASPKSLSWETNHFRDHIRQGHILIATKATRECVGYLVAYNETDAERLSSSDPMVETIVKMVGEVSFIVVEQVAIRRGAEAEEIEHDLFEFLLSEQQLERYRSDKTKVRRPVSSIFVATIASSQEIDTENVLDAFGFVLTLQYRLPEAAQSSRVSQIWHRTARPNVRDFKRHNDPNHGIEQISFALEKAQELYTHEDNLNWRKMSMIVTFLFAQLASLWVVLEKSLVADPPQLQKMFYLATVVVIGLIGCYSTFLTTRMLQSGRFFMAAHKANLKILQAQLRMRSASYIPDLWTVPTTSLTVSKMPDLSQTAFWISFAAPFVSGLVLVGAWHLDAAFAVSWIRSILP